MAVSPSGPGYFFGKLEVSYGRGTQPTCVGNQGLGVGWLGSRFVELREHQLPWLPPSPPHVITCGSSGNPKFGLFADISSSISPPWSSPSLNGCTLTVRRGRVKGWVGRFWPRWLWRVRSGNWIQQTSLRASKPACPTLLIVICPDGHRRWQDGPSWAKPDPPGPHIGRSWVAHCGARDPYSLIHSQKCSPPSALPDAMCRGQKKRGTGQNAAYGLPTGSVNNPLGAKAAAKWTKTKKGNFRARNMQANLSFWNHSQFQAAWSHVCKGKLLISPKYYRVPRSDLLNQKVS